MKLCRIRGCTETATHRVKSVVGEHVNGEPIELIHGETCKLHIYMVIPYGTTVAITPFGEL